VPGLFWAPEPDQIRIASHQGRGRWRSGSNLPPGSPRHSALECAGKCRGEHLVRVPGPEGSEHGPGHPQGCSGCRRGV